MTRNFLKASAIGAGLIAAQAATAATVDTLVVTQPVNGNDEFLGPDASLFVTVPPGQAAADVITNGETIVVGLIGVDDTGTAVPGVFADVSTLIMGGAPAYNNAAGNALQIDLTSATTALFFNSVSANGLHIVVRVTDDTPETGGNSVLTDGVQTVFNADVLTTDTLDMTFEADVTRPSLTDVFVSADGLTVFFVFSETLNNGAAGNDDNHTVLANIDATDFQVDTANSFDGTELSPAGLAGAAFALSNTVIQFNRDPNTTTLSAGTFVRPNFTDAGTTSNNQLFDLVNNPANATAVQAQTISALSISNVEFFATHLLGDAANQAVRVTYNLPLDPADLGDATFYGGFLGTQGSMEQADLQLSAPVIDPDNSSAVLLTIDDVDGNDAGATVTDNLFADGLDDSGNTFTLTTNVAGNVPSSGFNIGGNDYQASSQTVNCTDAIDPTEQFICFLDQDGDGNCDGFGVVYDEPITSNHNTATATWRRVAATVNPFDQITADGALTDDDVVADATPANNDITITNASTGDVGIDFDGDGVFSDDPARLIMGNAAIFSFSPSNEDWDNDGQSSGGGDTEEATPGTGGPTFAQAISVDTDFTVTDANGNDITVTGAFATGPNAGTDRAAPVAVFAGFFTGDNQNAGSAAQALGETDGTLGDQLANNRLAFFTSEAFGGGVASNTVSENNVTVNSGSNLLVFGDVNGADANSDLLFVGGSADGNDATFGFEAGGTTPTATLAAGATTTVAPGSGLVDGAGNEFVVTSEDIVDRVAVYVPLAQDVNGTTFQGGFLVDDDNDGLADRALLVANAPVDGDTLDADDFTISIGSVTDVSLDGSDATNSTIALDLGGNVPIGVTAVITYAAGNSAESRVASDEDLGGNGIAVNPVAAAFNVTQLANPNIDTDNVGVMDFDGVITIGGEPAPIGTKVYAAVAIPTPRTITATHNNVPFVMTNDINLSNDPNQFASFNAWTNWLLGIASEMYLVRNPGNNQIYANTKLNGGNNGSDAVLTDTMNVKVNANNISNITFTGTGETTQDKLSQGKVSLCWDVLRSNGGTLTSLLTAGYNAAGRPIVSSTVIDNADGAYGLHVGAPVGSFNGNNKLNTVNWPVIVIVELPNGQRFCASSIATAADGGPSLKFSPTNTNQSTPDDDAFSNEFNVDLDDIGIERVNVGWNTVPFARSGGFAANNGAKPDLPNGVDDDDIVVGSNSTLPFVNAIDQFPMFFDTNSDGMWTSADDFAFRFDGIVVDAGFVPHYAFTMTDDGIKAGSALNAVIGGYAYGFFNGTANNMGAFHFGSPLDEASPFDDYTNNNTTQGWGLFAITGTETFADLDEFDYIVFFQNINGAQFNVQSRDLAGDAAPNDLDEDDLDDVNAAFLHTPGN